MESSQVKWISFGILSILSMAYYYKNCSQQQQEYRKKIEQFERIYKESERNRYKKLDEIMKREEGQGQLKEKNVCFVNLMPNYNPDAFRLFERERSVYASSPRYEFSKTLQHQMGGEFFAFTSMREKILCKLNDFNLSASLLKQQEKDVHIFKGYNDLKPIVRSVTTTLNPIMYAAIYGKLYYDSYRLLWTIEPFFLTGSYELQTVVDRFYKEKIQMNSLLKFAIFISGIVLAYFTIKQPIQSWWKRRNLQLRQQVLHQKNDTDFFQKKDHIIVKPESLLNCEYCKTKNVEIVYECGHLALCLGCHDKNESKQCPLCDKISKKFMKVFMA